MRLSRVAVLSLSMLLLGLNGCGKGPADFVAKEEPWRADDERNCLAANIVADNRFVTARSALGSGVCGALKPFDMSAAAAGRVSMKPSAMLRCPMVPAVEHWVQRVVEPAARHYFRGAQVVQLKVAASYACRPINHQAGGKLSEHGHANALDISGFHLSDGRVVTVKDGWYGAADERGFLRAVHQGACSTFSTVLGPHADAFHRDHFHMDLARHGPRGDIRICK